MILESRTGRDYLDALVRELTDSLGVAYAFVARRRRGEARTAEAVSLAHRGGPVGSLTFPLDGTPCDDVLEGGACVLARGAAAAYPRDPALGEMGVESYVGTLLSYDGGRISGWLAVMDTAPMADPDAALAALRAAGARASVELERLDVEEILWAAHRSLEERVAARTRELEDANAALRVSEARFATAFRCSPDAMVITCFNTGHLLEVNDSFVDLTGYPREQAIGRSALELGFWVHDAQREALHRALEAGDPVRQMEVEFRRRDGELRLALVSAESVRLDDRPCTVAVISDVTDLRRSEERLVHNAFHDALTGLPNRALFMDRLTHALERTRRRADEVFGVLFVDVDRFKVVNDSLGHRAGDELLVGIARRLESCLRPGDTVARPGGDEFTVLLEAVADASDATRIADRIQQVLGAPFQVGGQEVFATVSAGLAFSGAGYEDPQDLVRDADLAMYRAKAKGGARCEVFDRAMHERVVAMQRLETDLRRSLGRGELHLVYQPLVHLATRAVVGFEALVRWQHPERGRIAPGEFIPLAEETGLIGEIGAWVLREACRQASAWQAALPGQCPVMAVNLSSRQFLRHDLVALVRRTVAETGMDPRRLHLELTESAVMENGESVVPVLRELKSLKVHLCLDDFGTGYSSLSYLHELPIDTLKIDRSFVGRMGRSGENVEIVRTIVALGQSLHKRVVAEGIENNDQLAQLRALQCAYGQGHLFAEPLDAEHAEALLALRGQCCP